MSQGLISYSPEAVSGISAIGIAIAKAGVVRGCDTPEKGMMFAMAAASRGVDILSLAQRYELVNGQLSMPAKVQLAEFRRRGGKHKLIERSPIAAEIELTADGETQRFRITWEEMRKECTPYNGKESETLRMINADNQKLLDERIKPKYATPRARMQMLWARLVSDSIGCVKPEVTDGVYTPEETEDFEESSSASSSVVVVEPVATPLLTSVADQVIDAEFPTNSGAHLEPFMATDEQVRRMTELFKLIGIQADGQMRAFKSVKADSMASVTDAGARELIARMETRLAQQAPDPPPVSEAAIAADNSAATAEQIDSIRNLIESVGQREGMANVPGRIKEHLNRYGIAKFSYLAYSSAQSLIDSLNGTKGLEDFFEVPPRPHETIPF